ncbi:phosphate acetyltransferase [Candidatus Enterococcus clewellii]|uniref:Phosphate acetyltransferase n=1 Tax=Candidatus Enterococcus clewellii TaxID=1834193 RepID=A0A242K3S8_9ENTE|nr:phosphate acetyltransferase [Enterococcus sp. 9E7_DIV0242]OTP13659.1 phosphate acetyltransferase [Enterococcus sp. 9E7_DIV0242]
MELFDNLEAKIINKNVKIVFPEALDPRILGAAARLKAEELLEPVLIGNPDEIVKAAHARGIKTSNFTIVDPDNYDQWDEMVESFVERRKGKVSKEDAEKILKDVNYFGTMLTYMGVADGMVSGAVHSTGDTVRPALQIIKTKPGVSRTSGAMIMFHGRGQERYIFSDCAINVNPNAEELAGIAIESAKTAKLFDIEPKVAMMSFSTKGSAKAPEVDKVVEATRIAKELAPDLDIDGELQFDASYAASVAQLKAPGSNVAGKATVFVFPELQSGNIGYKIAQRLGNFEAIGPILQGLNKPVSDLSRGANEEDVYKLSIITAAQALMDN